MATVNRTALERWRTLDAVTVLTAVAEYAKLDPTFAPTKCDGTTRWHISVAGLDFELLLTGSKFWDTRSSVGGGGAVDLVMHLVGVGFKNAVRLLRNANV